MYSIQLAMSDASNAKRLQRLLLDNGNWPVHVTNAPDFERGGVIVMDEETLLRLSSAPTYPDRVVLMTHNNAEVLERAWDFGIRSVVYPTETTSTMLLAIMSACLRTPPKETPRKRVISPKSMAATLPILPPTPSPTGK